MVSIRQTQELKEASYEPIRFFPSRWSGPHRVVGISELFDVLFPSSPKQKKRKKNHRRTNINAPANLRNKIATISFGHRAH